MLINFFESSFVMENKQGSFVVPSKEQRLAAIGWEHWCADPAIQEFIRFEEDPDDTVTDEKRGNEEEEDAMDIDKPRGDFFLHMEIEAPGPSDWLWSHKERGQTFAQYASFPVLNPNGRIIYLVPLGDFGTGEKGDDGDAESPSLSKLKEFVSLYFYGMDVECLPPMEAEEQDKSVSFSVKGKRRKWRITSRYRSETGIQLLTKDITAMLDQLKSGLRNVYCVMAITMYDLYPDPAWNFVFGEAMITRRMGVMSFARYKPSVSEPDRRRQQLDSSQMMLHRSCGVLAHEIQHLFGIQHCIYYVCCINGSNHLAESDSRPLEVCPIDLHKLYHKIGFNIKERYEKVLQFYEREGFTDDANWVRAKLDFIAGVKNSEAIAVEKKKWFALKAEREAGRGEWSCKSCTYTHSVDADECEMCGTPRRS